MAIKRPKPEEIVVKLLQVEVLIGQGKPRIDADQTNQCEAKAEFDRGHRCSDGSVHLAWRAFAHSVG